LFYSSPFFGSTAAEAFRALGIFCSAPLLPQRRRDVYWDSATDCLLCWMIYPRPQKEGRQTSAFLMYTAWNLWKERNRRVF